MPSGSDLRAELAFGSGYGNPHGSGLVRALQRRLAEVGDAPGPVDGLYGPVTEQAVRRFQVSRGLQIDGIAGPLTLGALYAPTPTLYPGAGNAEPGGSPQVRTLQRRLAEVGDAPGRVDGLYGPLTEQAVRRFQVGHGLHVDGIAGTQTLTELRKLEQPQAARHHRISSRPTAGYHPRTQLPHRPPVRRGRPAGWSALAWLALLLVVALVGLVTAARYGRQGRVRRSRSWGHSTGGQALAHTTVSKEGRPLASEKAPAPEPETTREPRAGAGGAVAAQQASARPEQPTRDAGDNAEDAFNLGVLLEERNDLAGAEAAYRRAEQLGHAAAACNLGTLLEKKGDLGGAEVAYRRAESLGNAAGAFNLGVLLEERNDVAGAIAALRRADRLGDGAGASNLGVMLEGRGDRAGAEAAYRRAAERGDANGMFNLGALLEERNDLTGAEAAYRRTERFGDSEVADLARAALAELHGMSTTAKGGSDNDQ